MFYQIDTLVIENKAFQFLKRTNFRQTTDCITTNSILFVFRFAIATLEWTQKKSSTMCLSELLIVDWTFLSSLILTLTLESVGKLFFLLWTIFRGNNNNTLLIHFVRFYKEMIVNSDDRFECFLLCVIYTSVYICESLFDR